MKKKKSFITKRFSGTIRDHLSLNLNFVVKVYFAVEQIPTAANVIIQSLANSFLESANEFASHKK